MTNKNDNTPKEAQAQTQTIKSKSSKPKPPVMVSVTVLSTSEKASLVEVVLDGKLVRRHVPTDKLSDGAVPEPVLEAGTPYGVEWEELAEVLLGIDCERLAVELRNRDIWTYQDTTSYPTQVNAAIVITANLVRATITEFARESEKE